MAKYIILVVLNLICVFLSLIAFSLLEADEFEDDAIEIFILKCVVILFCMYEVILIVLTIAPLNGTSMTYPFIISAISITFWILYLSIVIWVHYYIWSTYGVSCKHKYHIARYNNTVNFLPFCYMNLIFYSVVCISIIGDTCSLRRIMKIKDEGASSGLRREPENE